MVRRGLILALCALGAVAFAAPVAAPPTPEGAPKKVLRYAFRIAETGFDPAQITDLYSRIIAANIFEAPYQYEFLARPVRLRPNTAVGMPEHSADYRTWTVRIRPGIYFADDPAFKGQRRELTAQDYVYSFKRHYDPRWKSANLYLFENEKILGLSELRREVLASKRPFPYDREVEGIRALDRYTLQFKLAKPRPRFTTTLAASTYAAVAREVVRAAQRTGVARRRRSVEAPHWT